MSKPYSLRANEERKVKAEVDLTITELEGVSLYERFVSTDKRYSDYPYRRRVIGLRVHKGVPQALLTGFVTTWVKIDTWKRVPNGYSRFEKTAA